MWYSLYLDIPLYLWYNKYTKYIVYFSQKGWYKYWPIRQEKHETHTSESGTRKTPKSAENTSADIGRRWGRLHQKAPQTPQKPKISHKSAGGNASEWPQRKGAAGAHSVPYKESSSRSRRNWSRNPAMIRYTSSTAVLFLSFAMVEYISILW